MNKWEDIINMTKWNDLIAKKEEKKKCNTFLWVMAVIGAVAAIIAVAYAIYRYFTPDYLEDFEDDFDDDFDDDFFEDEEDEKASSEVKMSAEDNAAPAGEIKGSSQQDSVSGGQSE